MSHPRNVIMVVADSLRYDAVFKNGDPQIPYILNHSTNFSQARSSGCWTLPATSSLFTGLLPHEHGATTQSRAIRKDIPTLAEKMKAAGYFTYQITANVATTEIFGLHRGFDEVIKVWDFTEPVYNRLQQFLVLFGKRRLRKILLSKNAVMHKFSEDLRAAMSWLQLTHMAIFDKARELKAMHEAKGERCFLFINLMESHFPYHVSPTFETTSDAWMDKFEEVKGLFHFVNQTFIAKDKQPIPLHILKQLRERQRKSWTIIAPNIDNFVREMHEDTDNLLLFCSDHGDNFGEQGWQYHFSNVTDGGTRVPIFFLKPGQKEARTIDTAINAKDIHNALLKESKVDVSVPSFLEDPEHSFPMMQSYWYNNGGKTLDKYKFNQMCFVENNQRYLLRNNRWYSAEVAQKGYEPLFKVMSSQTNPVEELIKDAARKKYIQEQVRDFRLFAEKVGTK